VFQQKERMINLSGTWINYHPGNCPLPNGPTATFPLTAGPDGRVWINVLRQDMRTSKGKTVFKTHTGGILLFDKEQWNLFHPEQIGLPDLTVQAMACDWTGALWLHMSEQTLCRFDGQTIDFFPPDTRGLPSQLWAPYYGFAAGTKNNFWLILSSIGVGRFDGTQWRWFTSENSDLISNWVTSAAVDHIGRTWFAVSDENNTNFIIYDDGRWEEHSQVPIGHEQYIANALVVDKKGQLWVAWQPTTGVSDELGLWTLNPTNQVWAKYTTENSALPINAVKTLVIDAANRVWASTSAGFAIFDGAKSIRWTKIKPRVVQGPLNKEDSEQAVTHAEDQPYISISDIAVIDTKGRIWARSRNGVSVFTEA
jgi:ligand-binding sensor domain-containing protein